MRENRDSDRFHVSQWLGNWDLITLTSLSLEELALRFMYDSVFWAGVNSMTPTGFPNVILMDYLGVAHVGRRAWADAEHELRALAMGLNLYMVSQNCNISVVKNPLALPKVNALEVASEVVNGSGVRVDKTLFAQLDLKPVEEALARRKPIA